jgi:hypothetical protein
MKFQHNELIMYSTTVKLHTILVMLKISRMELIMYPSLELKVVSCQVCSTSVYETNIEIYMSSSVGKHIWKCSWQHSSHCNTVKLSHFRNVLLNCKRPRYSQAMESP